MNLFPTPTYRQRTSGTSSAESFKGSLTSKRTSSGLRKFSRTKPDLWWRSTIELKILTPPIRYIRSIQVFSRSHTVTTSTGSTRELPQRMPFFPLKPARIRSCLKMERTSYLHLTVVFPKSAPETKAIQIHRTPEVAYRLNWSFQIQEQLLPLGQMLPVRTKDASTRLIHST